MTSTGTVILVVSIAAILIFVVMQSSRKASAVSTPTGATTLNSLLSLGGAVFSAVKGKIQAPSSLPFTYGTDTASQASYGLSHGVVEQEGNQLIDLNTGNALDFGPF